MPIELLGRGAFGRVYRGLSRKSSNDVIKVGLSNLTEFAIVEYIMILSLNVDGSILSMSHAKDVELINGSVSIIMNYYGNDLMKFGAEFTFKRRILLIKPILLQASKALMLFKSKKIIHMDIKCENICVDKNEKLIFIDWGFAGLHLGEHHQKYADRYIGTHSYADPNCIKKPTTISYAHDMISMGISIISFVRQQTINPKKAFDIALTMDMDILRIYDNIYKLYGYDEGSIYVNILNEMLELDENKRITADELYSRLHNTEYTMPIEPQAPPIKYTPNNEYNRSRLYSEASQICVHYKMVHLYDYIIYLYEKLEEQMHITNSNCVTSMLSCVLIAHWTIHHHSGKLITIDIAIKKFIHNILCTREDLIDIILTNIQKIKYYILKFNFSTITPKILIETETQTDPPPQQVDAETQTDSTPCIASDNAPNAKRQKIT